jgi:hypothetical protein
MPWHPPIPAGKLYTAPALQLGSGLALLLWCYDGIQRNGQIEVRLDRAAAEMGISYRVLKDWWRLLRDGPFFCEQFDRGKRGWVVRMDDEWIDWRVLRNNYPAAPDEGQNSALEAPPSSPDEGQNSALDGGQVPVKSRSSPGEGQNSALDDRVYKEDQHDHESGDVASRETRSQRPLKKARDPTPAIVRQSLADVCGFDLAICSKENALQVNTIAQRLFLAGQKANKTPEETAATIRYVASYFGKNDWRGKKGERPTPRQLVDLWGAAIAARTPTTNGRPPAIAGRPVDSIPSDEAMRRVLAHRKQAHE